MFSLVYNLITRSIAVLLVSMLTVNYLPDNLFHDFPMEPKSMETLNYDSVIPQWNNELTARQPEYIQLNNILGPESIALAKDGLLYTGLADGRIIELDPAKGYKLRQVIRFDQSAKCQDNKALNSIECGRFLQLRFQNNSLYAIEASSGLYKIDIAAGTKTLVGPNTPLSKVVLYNSFTFDPKDGDIVYITVSSTRWPLQKIVWSWVELDSSGQVLAVNIKTGKRVIVAENLMMANGIDADVKRDRLVFSETSKSRVNVLPLKNVRIAFNLAKDGEKLSNIQFTPLIHITPGNPDNIIIESNMAYIALPIVKLNGRELTDHLSSMPNVRKAYGRFLYGSGKLLEYLCEMAQFVPLTEIIEPLSRELLSGHINYKFTSSSRSAIIEFNLETGSSRFLGTDQFSFLSEAVPDNNGNMLLGSFRSPFIVKVRV